MTYFFWVSTSVVLLLALRIFYYQVRFAERMRKCHPEKYRDLMGGWEGPAFTLTGHMMLSGALLGFLWSSQEDLGDSQILYLRAHHRRAVRQCVTFVAVVFLAFCALSVLRIG